MKKLGWVVGLLLMPDAAPADTSRRPSGSVGRMKPVSEDCGGETTPTYEGAAA